MKRSPVYNLMGKKNLMQLFNKTAFTNTKNTIIPNCASWSTSIIIYTTKRYIIHKLKNNSLHFF